MLNHHPSPEMLADFASGSLHPSQSLCIATHIELCSECRQYVKKLTALGACLLDSQAEKGAVEDTSELKNRIFAALDDNSPSTGKVHTESTVSKGRYKVPRALKQFIPDDYADLNWVTISPSIKVATLLKDKNGAYIALSKVKPGGKMPHHGHAGDELTVVLEGSFSDESGIYCKGDFAHREANEKHKPIVTKDAECICLMVLDAPIQFTGWFTRILNPLLRKNHGQIATY